MSFSHEYDLPVIVGSGSVLTSGYTADLKAGQFGFADPKSLALLAGATSPEQKVLFASGSWHSKDKLDRYRGGLKRSDKSTEFLVKDILSFEKSMPLYAKAEEWTLGWDGVSADSLLFECDTQYRFKVEVKGEAVYGTFLRPLVREIGFKTDCCPGDACVQTCFDQVPGLHYAKLIASQINTDPELKYFAQAEAIWSTAGSHTATHNLWHLTVADDGTQMALAKVQASTTYAVTKISRSGIYSTYEIAVPVGDSNPSNYTPAALFVLPDCDVCPAGFTYVAPKDKFYVVRPLSSSDDLSTGSAQTAYATAIGTAYATKTFDGASAVDPTTEKITLPLHGLATGTPVVYSNGGGTTITGLTSGNTYYIIVSDVNNVQLATSLANAKAGTAVNITADGVGAAHTLTIVLTPTFVSQNGATATVKLSAPSGLTFVAKNSDTVNLTNHVGATCTASAPAAISWAQGDARYKVSRTLTITLQKECGTQNRLADLQAAYAKQTDLASAITLSTAGTCSDIYTVTQYNKELLKDGCLTEGAATFDNLPAFEGFVWTAAPLTEDQILSTKVGVRITAAYEDTKFGGCSFSPSDYYSARPLRLEVTALVNGPGVMQGEISNVCVAPIPSRKTRYGAMSTQTGDWLIRKLIAADRYKVGGEFYNDPRLREVMDVTHLDVVDTHANYVAYFFKFKQDRSGQNHTADFSPEIWEAIIAFPLGTDTIPFENAVNAFASVARVTLKDR